MVAFAFIAFAFLAVANGCSLSCSGYAPGYNPGYNPCGGPTFPVVLDNCGPSPVPLPVAQLPGKVAPVIENPLITLPANIPAPRTINNVCSCVKTIVKPQVYQQQIAIPSVQRYLETTHTPVVENIVYNAVPVNCAPYSPEVSAILPNACGLPALTQFPAIPAAYPALPAAYPGCAGPIVPPCF